MIRRTAALLTAVCALASAELALAAEPLHSRIDALIRAKAGDQPVGAAADDAEFLRRVYLDIAGRIPATAETRAFLDDQAADKRTKLIDRLLASPEYARRMADLFHVMLMERMGDHAEWSRYLRESFARNKPWDQLAREILGPASADEAVRGAAFFYTKRLENYGQNPVDYPGLTRDVGRLFLGVDLKCAQCHDHLFVKSYKQADFQGLHAFFQNAFLVADAKMPAVAEKPLIGKLGYMSVFLKEPKETGPRVPGLTEIAVPVFQKGEEFLMKPDPKSKTPGVPKFSPLAKLAEQLPTADNPAFARNAVNRLWFAFLGRGLVHPLDLHHAGNPPSHPELLDLLAREFVEHKFDVQWLVRELVLSETYQRSSVLPADGAKVKPESFLVALEKRLSAEQLLHAVLEAASERETASKDGKIDVLQARFVRAFAGPRREPEDEIAPSLKSALFVLNDDAVLAWLTPRPGNLLERLGKLEDAGAVADELYLSVLTRRPSAAEKKTVAEYLARKGDQRGKALTHLAWALLASTEFSVNH